MPDIFISYKSEERPVAAALAARFTEAGYDVWWDAALLAGDRFEDEITAVLNASRAVVVLWSRRSAASDWVRAEAESARQQKKALPAFIDDVPPEGLPLLFRGLHVADLRGWSGDPTHPGFVALLGSLTERLGAATGPHLSRKQAEAKLERSADEAEVWAAIAQSPLPSADEYRAYLRRFGANGRFAELANIRIARLEAGKGASGGGGKARPRSWWPVFVLPLIALLVIAGAGGWYWQQHPDLFVPQPVKDAAARCAAWSQSPVEDWTTTLPALGPTSVADCETAATNYPANGDHKAMLAMVRVVQGADHADDGMALARQGVDLKSGLASYVLGVMYDLGLKLSQDQSRAADYYKTAFGLGVVRAAARLCRMAEDHGQRLPFSATGDEIYAYCRAANDAGDASGQVMMGYLYEYGDYGLAYDDLKAADLYGKAAAQGSLEGKLRLATVLIRGNGVGRDPARAYGLIGEVAATGNPEGLRWLGIATELGIGTTPDIIRASQLYEQAFARYDPISYYLLGINPPQDAPVSALKDDELTRLAGDQTSPVGQRILGQLLQRGYLRPMDLAQAVALYDKCGNAICQYAEGALYRYGPAQIADIDKARALFEQSAAAGEMHGQFELAYMYETGTGEPLDREQAIHYYQLAAAQGSNPAASRLNAMSAPPAGPAPVAQ